MQENFILLNDVEKMENNLFLSHIPHRHPHIYRGVGRIKKLVRVSKQETESKEQIPPKSTEVTCAHEPNVISEAKTDISTEGQGCAVC